MRLLRSLLFVLIGVVIFSACDSGPSKEDLLTGKWVLTSYSDNVKRSAKDQIEFEQSISALKIDLELFDNGEFSRIMMQPGATAPVKNIGEWYLENEDQILTMKVDGAPLSKLLIIEVKETKMTLQVEEEGVSTTLDFAR